MKKISAIQLLIQREIVKDRNEGERLILAGEVIVGDQRVMKPSDLVSPEAEVRLKTRSKYVSRGAEKMLGAVADFKLSQDFIGKVVLDIGASTGGFTQVALELGAIKVVALDVGTNQLDWKLRKDPRVESIEKTHVRDFAQTNQQTFDWILIDVSFISLAKIAEAVTQLSSKSTKIVALVKPQFELDADQVADGGVVADDRLRKQAVDQTVECFAKLNLQEIARAESRIAGATGNREIFVLFEKIR